MNLDRKLYKKYAESHAPRSPIAKNCAFAFLFGGMICCLSELFFDLYSLIPNMSEGSARSASAITLVAIAVLLSAIGVFDSIAKVAGAGTLVPVTGFANAVASCAIDSRAEGYVLGVGAKIFTVCGPVLLYASLSGTLYGLIYYLCRLIF